MQERAQKLLSRVNPSRSYLRQMVIVVVFITILADPVAAQAGDQIRTILMDDIYSLLATIVAGVAGVNGLIGAVQYMSAGANVEQDDKGRRRIRNSLIGLALAGIWKLLITTLEGFMPGLG